MGETGHGHRNISNNIVNLAANFQQHPHCQVSFGGLGSARIEVSIGDLAGFGCCHVILLVP